MGYVLHERGVGDDIVLAGSDRLAGCARNKKGVDGPCEVHETSFRRCELDEP
jgi:hypothetical protein